MRLDLTAILHEDGAIPFSYEPELSELSFSSIVRYLSPFRAEGRVVSSAEVLTLKGTLSVEAQCLCDRCGGEFNREFRFQLDTPIAETPQDMENPDLYPIEDGGIDVDEIAATAFVLGMESKLLCRPGCKGLCPVCGRSLNEGPCACKPEVDSRLAVLGQLLDQ